MAKITPAALTFGVEMEMVYVHDLSDFQQATGIQTRPENQATGRQRREYVASILRHRLPIGNQIPSLLGNIYVDDDNSSNYTQWTVATDASIGAGASEVSRRFQISRADVVRHLHWDQIELISPVFRFRSQKDWFLQLRQVERDLSSIQHLGASFCNESCGLHVHFALESHQPYDPQDPNEPPVFPLHVLQNLVILWAFWEKSIESLHPPYRHATLCEYSQSLLESVRGMAGFGSWADWAGYVYSLQSSEQIRNFIGLYTEKFVKLYISPARRHKRETVEFREHRGTTDAMEIRWWVVFVERVIQYAWKTAHAGIRFFIPGYTMWSVHNTEDIWRVIEMPLDGRRYLRGKIYEYSQLSANDFWQQSSTEGTDLDGSQMSTDGSQDNPQEENDEDIDPNYTTTYEAADGIQAQEAGEG